MDGGTRLRAESTSYGVLLERDQECGVLGGLVERASSGTGGLVVVEGGAGLGKSRLVDWSVEAAAASGLTPLVARGGDLEQKHAFGVVLQLLGPLLARATPDERGRAFSGAASLAAPLFDPGDWAGGHPPRPEQGIFHGLHWLVANVADEAPLLVCVDDAHWADQPSLRFLRYLAQRVVDLPVSIVVAQRTTGGDWGSGQLGELAAHPLAERLELQPLSREATAALAAGSVEEGEGVRLAEALFEATGGNPLFVHELLRAVRDGDMAAETAEVLRLARLSPRSISRHVFVRLARLEPGARELAGALAVLGDGTPLARAGALSGLGGDEAAVAADALAGEEVVAVGAGERLSFVHPLVREAVAADLPPVQRGRAHLRAAALLVEEGAAPEEVAAHLLLAPVAGEAFAADALGRAARRAAERGAPGHAVRYLRRALEEPLAGDRRASVLVALAEAEATVADPEAMAHLEEVLSGIVDPVERGRALMTLGRALEAQARHGEAAAAFEQAAGELAGEDRLERDARAAHARAASIALVPDAFAWVERVVERPAGDETPGELALLAVLAVQRTFQCAPHAEVAALAHRAWGGGRLLAEEGPDGGSWSVLTGACTWNDEYDLSEEIATAALEAARRSGSVTAAATASFCLAPALAARGRLVEALAHVHQALAAVEEGWETYRFACASIGAHAHLDRGELEAAEALLGPAGDPGRPESADLALALDARGRLRLLQGWPAEAYDDHLAAGRLTLPLADNPGFLAWRPNAALAAHRLGKVDAARELAGKSLEQARAGGAPRALVRSLRVAGLLEGGTAGLDLLEASVAVADEGGLPVERSWSLLELGAALRRAGERVRAREPLREALEVAGRCGASLVVGRAEEELRAAGARPRRLVRSGVDALTPSELRVARMAAEGMTNREIAQALFVTVHAVDKHLRGVFDKLSISSRRALPGALEAAGRGGRARPR